MGNGGEVAKHLARLPRCLLACAQVQFAINVWTAVRTHHYAAFFRLLRSATVLQASLMHRYVGEMRLCAVQRLARGLTAGGAKKTNAFPLADLHPLLVFPSREAAAHWATAGGLTILPDSQVELVLGGWQQKEEVRGGEGRNALGEEAATTVVGGRRRRKGEDEGGRWTAREVCRGKGVQDPPPHP